MKKYVLLIFLSTMIFAQSYMAKIQTYEEFTLYSQVSGQIIDLNKNDETRIVNKILIKLDDSLEKKQLKLYQNQLALRNEKLKTLQNNYEKFIKIKGKSQIDKDQKYYELLDLKINIDSVKLSISKLKDTIKKKSIKVNNFYVKKFNVNKGDYVGAGTKLAIVQDTTKSKLVIYVSSDDYLNLEKKAVYIDDKKGVATIEKIDKTPDTIYVSAYKVVLNLKSTNFGKIVKVEFKNE